MVFYRELPALRAQLTAHWQQRPGTPQLDGAQNPARPAQSA